MDSTINNTGRLKQAEQDLQKLQWLFFAIIWLNSVLMVAVIAGLKIDIVELEDGLELCILIAFNVTIIVFWFVIKAKAKSLLSIASVTDFNTGLNNVGIMFRTIEAEIDRSARRRYSLSFAVMDVDYFKRYNEHYGVKAGNRALAAMGEEIQKSTRVYDIAFRIGNDEFAVLLPETDINQSKMVMERIRKGFTSRYDGELGLSVGVASLEKRDDVDRIFKKAQAAMNEARRLGGGSIRSYIDRGQLE